MKLKYLTVLFILFVLGIIFLANIGGLPKYIRQLYDFPYGDKLGHFLLMGLLSFALNWTTLASRPDPKPASVIRKASLLLSLVVTLEEFSQQFLPRRTFSLLDLGFSYAGISLAAFLVYRLKRHL